VTAIIGILCTDGVVIAADSAATFAAGRQRTIEQPFDKIEIIQGSVIIAGTGPIGMGQRFCACVETAWQQQKKNSSLEIAKAFTAAGVKDFAATSAPQGEYGALVAYGAAGRPQLAELALLDFQPELKSAKLWYASMGSGQMITDPLLALMREVFWSDGPPPLQDGIFAATWVLQHAIAVNPGGVGEPLRIAVLERANTGGHYHARFLSDEEIAPHKENVSAAKEHLRDFKKRHKPEAAAELPPGPLPEPEPPRQ
jgi:hypothetical protein